MAREAVVSTRVDTPNPLCYNTIAMSPKTTRPEPAKIPRVQVIGVTGMPEAQYGDELGAVIARAAEKQGTAIESRDIVVVTQKIVSKAEGRIVDLREVEPSTFAIQVARESGRDARLVELVFRESRTIIRMDVSRGIFITETRHGFVCANAGIDDSNVPGESMVSLLPKDPDESAHRIQAQIHHTLPGVRVAVIVSDTFGRPWREGHVNFAIGVAGMDPIRDYRGSPDAYGRTLKVTQIAAADELASAAELVTGKASQVPAAIVRGYEYPEGADGVQGLLRPRSRDLFR